MSAMVVTLALVLSAAADAGTPASGQSPTPWVPSLLAPPKKSTPADRSYELHRAKDGSGDLVYEAPGFTARIARDGAARFIDRHFRLIGPWSLLAPVAPPTGQSSLQGLIVDVLGRKAPHRSRPHDDDPLPGPVPLVPTMTPYRPDPGEACTYPRPCFFEAGVVLVGVGGGFDLTDELMRLAGQDPYRYEKARFLAATGSLRGGLAARALAENVRRATKELPAKLDEIACDASRPVRERRATIEALRDEIAGDTPAARAAVATIDGFLAARFDGDRAVRCPAPSP
jgi:hypothetical protein